MAYDSTKPANGTSLVSADIRENFRALKEDGIVVATDASITQSKLKTSQGSVSTTGNAWVMSVLPGGEYGFYPQFKVSIESTSGQAYFLYSGIGTKTTSYASLLSWNAVANTLYAQQRYVTSSGEVFWIFILRDKITKDIISMYQAPDHPCFGNGGKPLLVPHPFGSYDPETQEIVVINPTHEEVENMKKEGERGEDEPDKDLLEVIMENYDIDEVSEPAWPSIPVTVGLPKDYEMKAMGEEVIPIKKVIPRPAGTLCRSLKKLEAENVAEKK